MLFSIIAALAFVSAQAHAYDQVLGFQGMPTVENRTIDQIYQAALKEGGVVTLWHGGDAKDQQDPLKAAFEKRFPGMTLNLTVDFSKYHGARLDRQLAVNNVYVDSIISESLHDYPRWKDEDALLRYKPLGFEHIRPAYRDSDASWYGIGMVSWSFVWNTNKSKSFISGFQDLLKPEYKNKLVLTYPNDDDAILFAFDLIMRNLTISWFDKLLAQNPKWVRGTETPMTILNQTNNTYSATFTSDAGIVPAAPFNVSWPNDAQFVSWPQGAAILKKAPHPEGAKLLHAFYLSPEYQKAEDGFTVRNDVVVPGQPFDASNINNTDPTAFGRWMADRPRVERLRFWFEDRLGQPVGPDPALCVGGIC